MDEMTFTDVVLLAMTVLVVQAIVFGSTEIIKKHIKKKRDNTIYSLQVNGVSIGKMTLKECRKFLDEANFKTSKGASRDKKNKVFNVEIDRQ